MMIRATKATIYQTSDGSQFLDPQAAKRRQIKLDLKKIFVRSADSYGLDVDALADFVSDNFGEFQQMFDRTADDIKGD